MFNQKSTIKMGQTNSYFYEGLLYRVEYKKNLSQLWPLSYTKKKVYHIHTDQESYPKAEKAIASIMCDVRNVPQGSIINKGLYQLRYKKNPTLENYCKTHYEFKWDDENQVYVYTLVEPYDD